MMKEHSHCKCGKVITYNWLDWTLKIQQPTLWGMCRTCRSDFIKEAVYKEVLDYLNKKGAENATIHD